MPRDRTQRMVAGVKSLRLKRVSGNEKETSCNRSAGVMSKSQKRSESSRIDLSRDRGDDFSV